MKSVKQRLIERIEVLLTDPENRHCAWCDYEGMLRDLRRRGSGQLPFYLREQARRWKIE